MFKNTVSKITIAIALIVALAFSLYSYSPKISHAQTPAASTSMYIKFDGIDGESQDKDHKRWIDVLSMSHSIQQSDTNLGTSRRRGDVALEDITLSKELDKSTPLLARAAATGLLLPAVQFHSVSTKPDGTQVYLQYELKNVMITSYSVSSSSGSPLPTESFSLNFEEIKITFRDSFGQIEASW